jgi:release factor glutamine methyltransferase
MHLKQALDEAIARLTAAEVGSPRMNAEVLLMFTLACDRAYLYAHPERELSADEQARYDAVISERATHKPTQYITGHQEFWGLDFIVSPAVLIPRPETEHVIETVLELAKEFLRPRIVDVGTGSGCIAIALAKELPRAGIEGVDISGEAIEIARANAVRLECERVQFRANDLLAGFPEASYDFIVSNPPYVGEEEPDKVQRQVREYEPKMAVFAGPNGMDVYRRLIPQAQRVLRPGGWLVMEIGFSIEEQVRALLTGWSEVQVTPDLQGIPRVIAARR